MKLSRREVLLGGSAALATACAPPARPEDAMITLRKADERFFTRWEWLDSRHTFSFADHYDPRHMGFRALRVINDDRIAPGAGFPMHPHKDMEIVSYVLDGGLEHKDSMGNGSVIRPGEIQRMSAGTGVRHSEYNPSKSEPGHFLQIWLLPSQKGIAPGYEQIVVPAEEKERGFRLVASPDGRDGSVRIVSDAELYATRLAAGKERELVLPPGRHAWVHVGTGAVRLDGRLLEEGDGAQVSDERALRFTGVTPGELLVFVLG